MKITILFACFVIMLASCSKSDDNVYPEKTYTSTSGTSITVLGQSWMTIIGYDYSGSAVMSNLSTAFVLKGKTNGDSIKIKTIRNGETKYKSIDLEVNKAFVQSTVIADSSFLQTNIPTKLVTWAVEVVVYKGSDSLKVPFKSEEIRL